MNALREKAQARAGQLLPVVVIQDAELGGFWIHRAFEAEDRITSHIADATSIAASRQHRWAKTGRIGGDVAQQIAFAEPAWRFLCSHLGSNINRT